MILLVTGCRSGIGLCTAVHAAQQGHTVYAGLRDVSTADRLMAAADGLDVRPIQLDVTKDEERKAAVAAIVAESGRIDALVNNAGIAINGFQEQMSEDDVRRTFDVNVIGPWALTRDVLPHMRTQKFGVVVHISSVSARMSFPGVGTYSASKAALESLSDAWRLEVEPFGVRMCVVEPGPFKTDIWDRNMRLTEGSDDPDSPYAEMGERLMSLVQEQNVKNAGDPMDVARLVVRRIEDDDPPFRSLIGTRGKIRVFLKELLPDVVFTAFVRRALTAS